MAGKKTSVIQVMIAGDSRDLQKATKQGSLGFDLLAGAAIAATKVIASAATAIAGFSIREFAKFDDAMTKSTAIMGDLSDAMRKDMSDAARQVALATSFSASEAAEAFFFLASAGLTAEQSIAALPKVAQFAQAGQFDLALATDLLTDAQTALGLSSTDAAENLANMVRVSDVLVKANTVANASVQEFSEALTEKAGNAMRMLGMEIEEGVALLAVFAERGIKGTKAGTLLNTTLEGLTRTARENADAYAAMGVSVFDVDGELRNMADIVGDMEGALGGLSTEAQLAQLATLGLTRQARDGALALLGASDKIPRVRGCC
jgi:TP901 family phage tail tape measure protein